MQQAIYLSLTVQPYKRSYVIHGPAQVTKSLSTMFKQMNGKWNHTLQAWVFPGSLQLVNAQRQPVPFLAGIDMYLPGIVISNVEYGQGSPTAPTPQLTRVGDYPPGMIHTFPRQSPAKVLPDTVHPLPSEPREIIAPRPVSTDSLSSDQADDIRQCREYMERVFPDPDVLSYFLKLMASKLTASESSPALRPGFYPDPRDPNSQLVVYKLPLLRQGQKVKVDTYDVPMVVTEVVDGYVKLESTDPKVNADEELRAYISDGVWALTGNKHLEVTPM